MTYRREPGSVEGALQEAVNAINPDILEAVTGKTRSAFEKAMNPFHPTQLTLKDAARIDAAVFTKHGHMILHAALESETRRQLLSMGEYDRQPVELGLRLSQVMKEVGDVAGAYAASCDPASDSGAERTREEATQIHKEVTDAINVLEAMKAGLETEINQPRLRAAQ